MNILVTGAFGNIGFETVKKLSQKGHKVRCFDIKNSSNIKKLKSLKCDAEVVWGDIRDRRIIKELVKDIDIVIHLAFIIPPLSESNMEFSWDINVEGTINVLRAMKESEKNPRIIFASSISVFGAPKDQKPPRCPDDQVKPTDAYSHHKVMCEHLIKTSGLKWCIMRLGAVLALNLTSLDPILFQVPLDSRIELIHVDDGACAFANAVDNDKVWQKVLLIGGGRTCQMYQKEFVEKVLSAVGIGPLDENAFSKKPFYLDWMDTAESQDILNYQGHDLDDFILEIKKTFGIKRYLIKLFRPIIRRRLLAQSPYFNKNLNRKPDYRYRNKRFIRKPSISNGSI